MKKYRLIVYFKEKICFFWFLFHSFILLLFFSSNGTYAGFDETAPTSADGGKPEVVRRLRERKHFPIVMIGDGVTDMQAKPPADAFIGYGGIVVRKPVKEGADLFITNFHDLIKHME